MLTGASSLVALAMLQEGATRTRPLWSCHPAPPTGLHMLMFVVGGIGGIAVATYLFITLRRNSLLPAHLRDELTSVLDRGDVDPAIDICTDDSSAYAVVVRSGLIMEGYGFAAMLQAAASAEEARWHLLTRRVQRLWWFGCGAILMAGLNAVLAFNTLSNRILTWVPVVSVPDVSGSLLAPSRVLHTGLVILIIMSACAWYLRFHLARDLRAAAELCDDAPDYLARVLGVAFVPSRLEHHEMLLVARHQEEAQWQLLGEKARWLLRLGVAGLLLTALRCVAENDVIVEWLAFRGHLSEPVHQPEILELHVFEAFAALAALMFVYWNFGYSAARARRHVRETVSVLLCGLGDGSGEAAGQKAGG